MDKKRIFLVFLLVTLLCGAAFFGGYKAHSPKVATAAAERSQYPLLAGRIFADNPNDTIINFSPLRNEMTDYYTKNNLQGSVYFEYLPSGTSIRLGNDEDLVAASLMKTAVVMELYRASELGRINLDQKISLKKEWLDAGYGTLYQKGEGYQLTLREAAHITLTESDNTAVAAILGSTQGLLKADETSVDALDVDYTRGPDLVLKINAKSYSSFMKCLYFSCYNNFADSQEILKGLSESTEKTRLVAGVPSGITVAHKIGTNANVNQGDCGIIYEPKRNYALCVMIRGGENEVTDKHIATLSRMAYDYVHSQSFTSPKDR